MIKHPNSQESAASTIDIDRLPYKTLYNLTISSKNLPPPTSDSQLIITTCGFVSNKRHVIYSLPFQVMCHTHSHTCFAFFITFFPTDFQAKERQLAVYWGHQDQQCLAALVESSSPSKERSCWTFQDHGLGFQPDSPHKPISPDWFYFENVTKGPQVFYHEYNVSSFKITPLSLQWLPSRL